VDVALHDPVHQRSAGDDREDQLYREAAMEYREYHEQPCEHQQQEQEEEHRDQLVQTTAELANDLETPGEVRVWDADDKLFAGFKGEKKEDGSVSVVDLSRSLISRLFNPYDFQSRITKK